MKKILALSICFLVFSCESEEDPQCNCGLIVSDDVSDYSVVIRSDCSGNEKKFTLQEGDWFNAHPGENFCITNSTGW
ncbi:MAG: hypothetical protein ABF247_09455 [Nonlabens sp.]|uniref:hypothetical protein n=1 Tax=Nonlabens sp. TaxID=1888209 RepID=UPI00321B81E3